MTQINKNEHIDTHQKKWLQGVEIVILEGAQNYKHFKHKKCFKEF